MAPVLVGLVFGAVGGWLGAPWLASHLGPPVALDRGKWTVLVPGRKEGIASSAGLGGSGVVDGELVLVTRAFGRSDILVPAGEPRVGEVDIGLAPSSGTIVLNVRGEGGEVRKAVEVGPEGWRTSPGEAWKAPTATGPFAIVFGATGMTVDGVATGSTINPGRIEVMPGTGSPAITALRLVGPDGAVVADEAFGPADPETSARATSGVGGAVFGALAGALARAGIGGVVELFVMALWPTLVLLTPYATWRSLTERLYLADASPSDLRSFAFACSLAPLLGSAVLATGLLATPDAARQTGADGRRARAWAIGLALVASVVASRDLVGPGWLTVLPGVGFLLWPVAMARLTGRPLQPARDLPALAAVAVGGWGYGLLPAAFWRLLGLLADAPTLVRSGAAAGTWGFAITVLAGLLGTETAVRTSFLGKAWDPVTLAGASLDAIDQPHTAFVPFWTGDCDGTGPRRVVYTFGGSSAGGAYQFRNEPEAFFPARLHTLLCATGASVSSRNYGESGRDSFDAANAATALFADASPALTIVYTGVNDLLTADHPYSRREMAARRAAMGTATTTLDAIGSSSRTLTGLSLLLRPPADSPKLVAAVPVDDAEANLRTIIAATTAHGGHVLLVPEYAAATVAGTLKPYFDMERRVASTVAGAEFVDIYPGLDAAGGASLLADRNHLTREGCGVLAGILAPEALKGLGVTVGGGSRSGGHDFSSVPPATPPGPDGRTGAQ